MLTPERQKGQEYHCQCGKWVLENKRARHERTHDVTWACRICRVRNKDQYVSHLLLLAVFVADRNGFRRLSRKDALKRHILMQHREDATLLSRPELNLLEPCDKDADEDLEALEQAMEDLSTGRQAPA